MIGKKSRENVSSQSRTKIPLFFSLSLSLRYVDVDDAIIREQSRKRRRLSVCTMTTPSSSRRCFSSSVPTVVRSELLNDVGEKSSGPIKYLLNAPALRCRFTPATGDYAVLCKDRSVVLCNPRTRLTLKEYTGVHAREVRDATASRDNSRLVSCGGCLLYTSPSPRDYAASRMPSSA